MKISFISLTLLLAFVLGASAKENPFLSAGVPATTREWQGRDYLITFQVMQSGKVPLPLLSDANGKQLIERLTNVENFAFNKNKKLPFNQRMTDFMQMQQGFNAIMKIYGQRLVKSKDLHEEAATLQAFSLRIAELGLELLNEFIPTIPKDDKYEIRMQGLKKVYQGMTTMFVACEISLTETQIYTKSDLSLILQSMEATLPSFLQSFSPDYKQELKMKLTGHKKSFSNGDLALLQSMIKLLNEGKKSQ